MGEKVTNQALYNLVAVTGDIASKGRPEEYALAEAWFRGQLLPATGLRHVL